MKEKRHLDVKYVAKALPKRQTWLLTLVQFMRERSDLSAVFVTTEFLKSNMKVHAASVHEGKKPFKCDYNQL